MIETMTRAQLLSRGARGGSALLVGGAALGQYVDTAAADPIPPADLAYSRLLVGAELLASAFYRQAIAASITPARTTKYLKRAHFNEQEHYKSVAGILSGAGITPAVSGDIDFTFPKATFARESSILEFAVELENLMLGTYLGAVSGLQTTFLKPGIGQIAANEAQHLTYFSTVSGGRAFNLSFPPALTIEQASNAMDAFAS